MDILREAIKTDFNINLIKKTAQQLEKIETIEQNLKDLNKTVLELIKRLDSLEKTVYIK